MLALPPKFLQGLERSARHPFALLEIQSTGQSDEITSEADFGTATAESNVDYTPTPPDSAGDCVIAAAATTSVTSSIYAINTYSNGNVSANGAATLVGCVGADDNDDTTYIRDDSTVEYWFGGDLTASILSAVPQNAAVQKVSVTVRARTEGVDDVVSVRMIYSGTEYVVSDGTTTSSYADITKEWAVEPAGSTAWTYVNLQNIDAIGFYTGGTPFHRVTQVSMTVTYYDFETTASITVPLDLTASANTANSAIVSIDDLVPTGGGLTYTAEGSTTGAWGGEEVSIGSVSDGSEVTGYRYYRVTAAFTSDGTVTPVLKSVKIEIPDNIYLFSSLSDYTLNAYPWLKDIPGRNIKLNLKDMITEGSSMTVNLDRTDFVDEMVRSNNFRGLHTKIQIGLYTDDITTNDLVEYYQGRITDYALDEGVLKITLKDSSKDLSFKIPDQTGTTKTTVSYDGTTMADVISDLLDKAGIASRYIDRGSLDTIEANIGDGTPASANWVVNRTGNMVLSEPQTAKKLITELLEIMGCYAVIQENGKLQFIEYDSTTSAQETWGRTAVSKGYTYKANLEALRNQFFIYYDWVGKATTAVSGSSEADYASIYVVSDATSISNWNTTATKIIKTNWISGDSTDGYYGDEMAAHIADREVTRLKDGLGIFSCKTSLDKAGIQVGDFINIDTSEIDVVINPDVDIDATRKFLVTSKNWDVAGEAITWELTEAR